MQQDYSDVLAVAQSYFEAAYEMNADQFATLFYPASSITRVGDDGKVNALSLGSWLAVVRSLKSPKQSGLQRKELRDEVVSIDVVGNLAVLRLKFSTGLSHFNDVLCCLKADGEWKIAQKVMTVEAR